MVRIMEEDGDSMGESISDGFCSDIAGSYGFISRINLMSGIKVISANVLNLNIGIRLLASFIRS